MRGVVKPLPPVTEDAAVEEHADVATGEPETTEGAMPTDMTQLFNSLMKAG
jgi:hypothetical protein